MSLFLIQQKGQAHGHQAFFGSHPPIIFSRFPDLRIIVRLRLLMPLGTMAYAAFLPAYSDRIAQDSHLIPFYPRLVAQAALNLRGTENFDFLLYLNYIASLKPRQLNIVIISNICYLQHFRSTTYTFKNNNGRRLITPKFWLCISNRISLLIFLLSSSIHNFLY